MVGLSSVQRCCRLGACLTILAGTASAQQSEPQARNAIWAEAARHFKEANFSALEETARDFRVNKVRTEDGNWKLAIFYQSFQRIPGNEPTLDERTFPGSIVKAWIQTEPNSPTPHLAAARIGLQHALQLRPLDLAANPQSTAAKAYRQALQRVADALDRTRPFAAADPEWFVLRMELANFLGAETAQLVALLRDGLKQEPYYYPLYYAGLHHLLEKNAKDVALLESFARSAIDDTRPREGTGIYARIYWYLKEIWFDKRLFAESKIDWNFMKGAIRDLLDRYPTEWNINNLALIACLANDRVETKRLLKLVGLRAMPEVWHQRGMLAECDNEARFKGQEPARPPVAAPADLLAAANAETGDDWQVRREIALDTLARFERGDYASLVKTGRELLESKARAPSGQWKLSAFHAAFARIKLDGAGFDETRSVPAKFAAWMKEFPGSPVPYLAYARALRSHAWSIRGSGVASSVSEKAWKPFNDTLRTAAATLTRYKGIASKDPEWFVLMLEISTELDFDQVDHLALVREGARNHPGYYNLYSAGMRYFLPRWRGSNEQLDVFARAAVEAAKLEEGAGVYARLYAELERNGSAAVLFDAKIPDWTVMKAGIREVLAKYPDQWNLNLFASLACRAGDAEETQRLFSVIRRGAIPAAWRSIRTLARCERLGREPSDLDLLYARDTQGSRRDPDDLAVDKAIREETAAALTQGNFAKLEKLAQDFRESKARLPGGMWKLANFYQQFDSHVSPELDLDDSSFITQRLKAWIKAYPNSPTPYIAYARVHLAHAAHLARRTTMRPGAGPTERSAVAGELLNRSEAMLRDQKEVASRDPEWYPILLGLLDAKGDPQSEYASVMAEAVRRHPAYESIYFAALDHFLPDWDGDFASLDTFARAAVKATSASEGWGMYVKVFSYATWNHGWRYPDTIDERHQAAMRAGAEDLLKRYPSNLNLNAFAMAACISGDQLGTYRLMKMMKNGPDERLWLSRRFLDHCRHLVGVPSASTASP